MVTDHLTETMLLNSSSQSRIPPDVSSTSISADRLLTAKEVVNALNISKAKVYHFGKVEVYFVSAWRGVQPETNAETETTRTLNAYLLRRESPTRCGSG